MLYYYKWKDNCDDLEGKIRSITGSVVYGTTDFWAHQRGYIPPKGTIVVYVDYYSEEVDGNVIYYPTIKIGDGVTNVIDLQFVNNADSFTNPIAYQLRTNVSTRPVSSDTYGYRLLFSSLDNYEWVPANNSSSTDNTHARAVNQEIINPFGRIVYYSGKKALTTGQLVDIQNQWDRYNLDLGYSFNNGSALNLTFPGPVYIKCTPTDNGGAVIDQRNPITQTLPDTKDGSIYIYCGQAYSASEIELVETHPVFYHDGTRIAIWTSALTESDLLNCNMINELVDDQIVWNCDHTWDEIYTAIQDGKIVRLLVDGITFMPFSIQDTTGAFSNSTHIELENNSTYEWNVSFTYDNGVWELHNELTPVFTSSDKTKLDSIEEGAQVNVQSDWNQSDNDAPDYIKNKPSVEDFIFEIHGDGSISSSSNDFTFNKSAKELIQILLNDSPIVWRFIESRGYVWEFIETYRAPQITSDRVRYHIELDCIDYGNRLRYHISLTPYYNFQLDTGHIGINMNRGLPFDIQVNDNTVTIQKNGTTIDSFTLNASSDKTINIDGVQDQITSTNKLSADLVEDGDTNKVYTTTEKTKLAGIEDGAEVNVQSDWSQTITTAPDYIKNKPVIVEKLDDLSDVEIFDGGTIEQTYFEDAVEDYDGNKYDVVIIGDQVWMAENLRTTHYTDGTPIENGNGGVSLTIPYYHDNTQSIFSPRQRGLFYNTKAIAECVVGDKNIAPEGFRIPSWNDLTSLLNYVNSEYGNKGKSLAYTSGWQTSNHSGDIGYHQETNNASKFSIAPVGSVGDGSNSHGFIDETKGCSVYSTYTIYSGYNLPMVLYFRYNETSAMQATQAGTCSIVRCVCDLTADEFRTKMLLKGKVLMHDDEKWVAGDIADITIQSDWNQTTTTAPDYIKNKPSIPTISLENFNNTDWDYVFNL